MGGFLIQKEADVNGFIQYLRQDRPRQSTI